MSYIRQISLPASEPVLLTDAKTFCKVPTAVTDSDTMITGLISAARVHAENITNRCLAQRNFVMVLDRFSHHHHYAFPYGTFWPIAETFLFDRLRLRGEIKIPKPPLQSIASIRYVNAQGLPITLLPDVDFIVDRISEPARMYPPHGQYWPLAMYVANAIEITLTAGYDPNPAAAEDDHQAGVAVTQVAVASNVLMLTAVNDYQAGASLSLTGFTAASFLNGQSVTVSSATSTQIQAAFTHANYGPTSDSGTAAPSPLNQQPDSPVLLAVPETIRTAILMLVNHWFYNREPVAAGSVAKVPHHVDELLAMEAIYDFSPS